MIGHPRPLVLRFLGTLVLAGACAQALPAEVAPSWAPVVRQWTVADGLPVEGVNGLEQTSDGFLWLATWDGLVRFDGVRFRVFGTSTHPELPSARFTALLRTADDTLWLTTEYHDLVRVRDGRFETVVAADAERRVSTIHAGRSGAVLVGLEDRVVRASAGGLETVVGGIPGDVLAIHEGTGGRIWAGTGRGELYRVGGRGDGEALSRVEIAAGEPVAAILSLLETGDGALLVGTERGLWRLARDGTAARVPVPGEAAPGRPAVLALDQGPAGGVRVVTATDLFRLDPGGLVRIASVRGIIGTEPLAVRCPGPGPSPEPCVNASPRLLAGDRELLPAGSAIKDLLIGREGSLWVATSGDGLYQLRAPAVRVLGRAEGLPSENVYPIVEGPGGSLWLGAIGGLARFRDGEVDWWAGGEALPVQAVWTVLVDREERVWVGGDRGLCRFRDGRCHPVPLPGSDARSEVRALFEDRSGRIWVGARSGVFVFDGASRTPVPALAAASGGQTARAFLQAADGAVWVGTAGAGLFRVADGSVDRLTVAQGLASGLVRALHEDRQGRLWVGTEGRGLCRITEPASPAPRIDCVDSSRGLYDDGIHRILDDGLGRFWMSTSRGLFRVLAQDLDAVLDGRLERLDCRSYTERHGLRHREANGGVQSAGVRASDGRLWFPTQGGVAVIDPRRAPPAPAPVPVVGRVQSDGLLVQDPRGSVGLPRGARDLTVAFTAPSFIDPDQVRFRHRLAGHDRRWIEAGALRQARYTSLPPGRYELEVEARSADGLRSGEAARLAVVVPAFFWETTWFRGGVLLALLAGVGVMVQRRGHAQERRRRLLERQVEDRTADLEREQGATARALEMVREQKELLEEMSEAKMRFFANVSHELRTPLTLLLGPLREAAAEGRPPSSEEREMMLRNAVRLERLLDLIRDLQKIDAAGFRLRIERIDLARLAAEVGAAFAPLGERKGVELACRLPEGPVPADADPEQMERILGNLLSNAIKFTPPGGAVELRLEAGDDEVEVSVADDGPGIPAESVSRIFDRFFQLDAAGASASEGMGIGLAMARELARLHGGEIEVESEPGEGSLFTVRWPRFRGEAAPEPLPDPTEGPEERSGEEAAGVEPDPVAPMEATAPTAPSTGPRQASRGEANEAEPAPDGDRKTVLLVDDDADVRSFVRSVLEPEWSVVEAADGPRALDLARRRLPDLVVADVTMPAMDGFELARRLRGDPETGTIPLVFLTARAEDRDLVAGFDAGGDQYVTKPFSPEVLRARVAGILEQRLSLRRRLLEEAERSADGGDGSGAPEDGFVERARRVVRRRLPDSALDVDRLAAELALSRRQLYRRLAEEGAPAPAELIREERLARAAELLRAGEGTVSEVAYAVGFGSLAAFSRRFRERYGVPPSAHT